MSLIRDPNSMNSSSTTAITNLFKNDSDIQTFLAGQTIFEQGEEGEVMYVIQSGEVNIVAQDKVINTHKSGEVFGEMALIDTRIRSATALAKTDCQLVPIKERRFRFLIQQHPFFALNIMRVLAARLRRQTES